MTNNSTTHPKGLYILFMTEMWERFSYYGMRAILILFMTKALLMDKALASNIYGSYTGLVYLTPLLGGYLSDRYWGNRKSILIGGLVMALGQFIMFFSASMYENLEPSRMMMYLGLVMLIFGNGFFKPNISTMVGQLYPQGDKRVDSAFTIFYMGINIGAFFAPLVCGGIGDTGSPADFKWGFMAAGVGMLISTITFYLLKNKFIVDADGKAIGMPKKKNEKSVDDNSIPKFSMSSVFVWFGIAIALILVFHYVVALDFIGSNIFAIAIAVAGLIITDKSLTKTERQRIWVIFILCFFVVFFWSAFEQAGASLTFFAEEQTNRDIPMSIPGWLILISFIALAYYLIKFFTWLLEGTKKTAQILSIVSIAALLILYFTGKITSFTQEVIPASWFQAINALAIVALAPFFSMLWLALGKKNLEPSSPLKMAFGLLFLSLGYVVIAMGVHNVAPGVKVSLFWLTTLYLLHTVGELCLSPIGLSMVSKLAPLRFASLLMGTWFLANATANKFAGTLSALYPPGPAEFNQAAEKGINNLPDILNGTASASVDQIKILSDASIPYVWPQFLGMQITDLYSFFIIFVAMSAIASGILFVIYRWLSRMMHGIH
ncbi:MAG TPA: peptide MFS transporter [Bacteroidia bacterium]|nr:peptide MFS transporter [Bacteroidia bacterium]